MAAAARILAEARVPYVVSPHGTAPLIERRFLAKQIFDATAGRGYLEGAARVLAVSEAERAQLRRSVLPTTASPSCPTRSTCASSIRRRTARAFAQRHGLGDAPVVLLLAKLTPRKGADVALRAFEKVGHRDARFVIAGSDMGSGLDDRRPRRPTRA